MWQRDHSVPVGTNTGRLLPCDVVYRDGQGTSVRLEVSLDVVPMLPERCENIPSGSGIRVGTWDYAAEQDAVGIVAGEHN